jgi:RNA polymerase sigma factor, sigma-70 family
MQNINLFIRIFIVKEVNLMNEFYGTENYVHYLIETYSDMLIRITYSYMKNLSDAEDITQEVFIKIIEKQPSFETEKHEKAWLIRCSINLCKDRLKSSYFKNTTSLEDDFIEVTPEDNYVIDAVLNLPLKYRSIVLLYYYEGYSISEISNILSLKEATVGSQLSRARQKLKIILKEDFEYEYN